MKNKLKEKDLSLLRTIINNKTVFDRVTNRLIVSNRRLAKILHEPPSKVDRLFRKIILSGLAKRIEGSIMLDPDFSYKGPRFEKPFMIAWFSLESYSKALEWRAFSIRCNLVFNAFTGELDTLTRREIDEYTSKIR